MPLKNVNGEVVLYRLFINDKSDYLCDGIFDCLSVHSECLRLAKEVGCSNLSDIHYDYIEYKQNLTADDIETLKTDKLFLYGRELLGGFVKDGFVKEELIEKYGLGIYRDDEDENYYEEFPNNPVKNVSRLCERIKEQWEDPVKIVKVQELKTVKKKEYKGKQSDINYNDLRYGAMERYASEDNNGKYFCQMCKKAKDKRFIEVNNIEFKPEYYWEQLRLCLCLECSKTFEIMRYDESLMKKFKANILAADCKSEEPVAVSIDNYRFELTFTQIHLAEVQEILKLQEENE